MHANLIPKEKGLTLIADKKKSKKKKEKRKVSSNLKHEIGNEDEFLSNEMTHFIKRMMRRSKNFDKKDIKKMFKDSKKKGISKSKSNVTCFICNSNGHYKLECLKLLKQEKKLRRRPLRPQLG